MPLLPVAVLSLSSPACWRLLLPALFAGVCAPAAWAQSAISPPPASSDACALQPSYPLPTDRAALEALALRQQAVSGDAGCLKSAAFHAWRGATLLALGRAVEAVEPLERALLQDPDLPGAQLDLAQALALQGDHASARFMLAAMRERPDLPLPIGSVIDRQLDLLAVPAFQASALEGWQSRWQFSALGGADSNLNNAPATSEITLTLPQGNVTLPLDVSSQPRRGGAVLAAMQWQGLRTQGDSLWVLQAEVRARQTGQSDTSYQQSDAAASWLQAPAASRQWVARLASSHLQYGGSSLLQATRGTLQYQWEAPGRTGAPNGWRGVLAACRPTATAEVEHRRYPTSRGLDGIYGGGAAGWLCRRAGATKSLQTGDDASSSQFSFYSLQARYGSDRPLQDDRPGGTYRRAEIKAQWEGPLLTKGRLGVQWTSTRQIDGQPYSVLLGNLPRRTLRHVLQLEASWPIATALSVVGNAETSLQTSNLPAFESRQRSIYLGLRWELTQ